MNKVTCGQHRIAGLAIINGVWACRTCKRPDAWHETNEETVARNKALADLPVGQRVTVNIPGFPFLHGLEGEIAEVRLPEVMGNPGFEIVTKLDFGVRMAEGLNSGETIMLTADELVPVVDAEIDQKELTA